MKPLLVAILLLCCAPAAAQVRTESPVTLAWDEASTSDNQMLLFELEVDGTTYRTATQKQSPPLPLGKGFHTARVLAETLGGVQSAWSLPLEFIVGHDPSSPECLPPLGNRSVSIFPTGYQKAGARARLDFQLASPNSPITRVAVKAQGVELAVITSSNVGELAGMWFTLPVLSGSYTLGIVAENAYGCVRDVMTTRTVVVP